MGNDSDEGMFNVGFPFNESSSLHYKWMSGPSLRHVFI